MLNSGCFRGGCGHYIILVTTVGNDVVFLVALNSSPTMAMLTLPTPKALPARKEAWDAPYAVSESVAQRSWWTTGQWSGSFCCPASPRHGGVADFSAAAAAAVVAETVSAGHKVGSWVR